jgi:aconitate hydratase
MAVNSFHARERLTVGELAYEVFRLDRVDGATRLPYSLKVLLENLLRNEDGALVTAEQVNALSAWNPTAESGTEVQFTPARVLLQDFTGVPCVVDLVAMRDAMADLGGDPRRINPLIPAELVIDHSVIADVFGRADAFRRNADLEFDRNPGALPVVAVGAEVLRRRPRRATGHRHLPPGEPRVPVPGRVHHR